MLEISFLREMKTLLVTAVGLFCLPVACGFVYSALPSSRANRFAHLGNCYRAFEPSSKRISSWKQARMMADGKAASDTLDINACSLDEWFSSNGYKINTFSNIGGSGWVRNLTLMLT